MVAEPMCANRQDTQVDLRDTESAIVDAGCYVCANNKGSLKTCVACGQRACSAHRGDEGDGYWIHWGKKGYACGQCIRASLAYEGGPLAVGREIKAHVHAVVLPELLAKVRDEVVPPLVDNALTRVETLTKRTLDEAEATTSRLVERLEQAIGSQRVEVKTDIKEVIDALSVSLRTVLG